jgi:aspartyl-tRNA(Asn)/glutamyl-tRNA(Gln) amidotransferase subunit C
MLARLALTDDEVEAMRNDLNSILGHIDDIQRLDLHDVVPMAHAIKVVNVTRPDVVVPPFSQDVAVMNAPQAENGAFVIPQIVGGGDEA